MGTVAPKGEHRAEVRAPPAALCRRALAALHVGLVLLEDGQVTWANAAAVRLFGAHAPAAEPWRDLLALAQAVGPVVPRTSAGRMHPLGTLSAPAGRLHLCGARLPRVRGGGRSVLLIAVELRGRSGHRDLPTPPEQRPADARLRGRFQLTPQECQVARLLADGVSNARVAATLGISPNTARIHTERVLRKLGVHSRAAVASVLMRG